MSDHGRPGCRDCEYHVPSDGLNPDACELVVGLTGRPCVRAYRMMVARDQWPEDDRCGGRQRLAVKGVES